MFSLNKPGLLGIDIGDDAVRVVELGRRRGALQHWHSGMAALPPGVMFEGNVDDIDALASLLRQACQASGSRCSQVALAMPISSLITQTVRLPAGLPDEQLEILVELEAAQYMPFSVEEACLDFCVMGRDQDSGELDVLLVVARRSEVQRRLEAAAKAGLEVVIMDSEALALQAGMAHGGWQAMPDGTAFQLAWGLALHGFAR
ncbi:type IV pilus biogenesis protein PilM [Janthinobacterium sp. RB2R34]|uniref:type IV pilus biogenesis protein PilM n=1 Tax=Janthinobacterium sp. RB2R34 TaxID=3424193 RepID=UPI003F22866E